MPSPVRGARVRQRESGVPEVPHQKACTTAVGFCRIGQGFIAVGSARRAMRILRRSARAGGMLDARHELDTTPEEKSPDEGVRYSLRWSILLLHSCKRIF